MKKLDLWGDCPYWPEHRFKKNRCIGCGFEKLERPKLNIATFSQKSTIEFRINKILQWRENIADYDITWFDRPKLADFYNGCEYSGYGTTKLKTYPSAPLRGEKRKNEHRLKKVADVITFYESNWPKVKKTLDEIFSKKPKLSHLREKVERFIRSIMFTLSTPTKKQIEQLTAAYTYYESKMSERQVAESQSSIFPNVSRKTLRKWAGFVRRFEKANMG